MIFFFLFSLSKAFRKRNAFAFWAGSGKIKETPDGLRPAGQKRGDFS